MPIITHLLLQNTLSRLLQDGKTFQIAMVCSSLAIDYLVGHKESVGSDTLAANVIVALGTSTSLFLVFCSQTVIGGIEILQEHA